MSDQQARSADRERVRELFAQMRSGEDTEAAREELVRLNYPLVEYLVRRFRGRGEPVEDLMQVASIGLLKAIDRFDIDREVEFSTYATPTIIGELKRHFRDKGWAIRVPRRLQEVGMQITKVVAELSQELGRSPTVAEIAQRSGFDEDEVLEGMDTVHAYSTLSLDAPATEDGAPSLDTIGEEDETLELLESWTSVAPLLKKLPARERRILYLRFFRGLTQSQIAQELNISQMHVSRLLSRTLAQLREQAGGGFGG
jgi:RNA polymerase sigma-B factor